MPKRKRDQLTQPAASPRSKRVVKDPYANVQLPISNKRAIRLLEILPSKEGTHLISCVLRLGSLDENYVALSYVWGPELPEKRITLNGQPFVVRQNLWDFLSQERTNQEQDGPRLLWIDALCIQQDSVLEKNHQVALMGQIYTKAVKVVVWLGTGRDHLALWDILFNSDLVDTTVSRSNDLNEHSRALFCAWDELQGLAYWSRAWILQEFVLAAELQIQVGSRQLPLSTLQKGLGWSPLRLLGRSAFIVLQARANWHDASARRYFCPWDSSEKISHCSDPRDRIYSTIAIMDPAKKIAPDYQKTIIELFTEVVEEFSLTSYGILGLAFLLDLISYQDQDFSRRSNWNPVVRSKYFEAESREEARDQWNFVMKELKRKHKKQEQDEEQKDL